MKNLVFVAGPLLLAGVYTLGYWRFKYEHSKKIGMFDFGVLCVLVGFILLVLVAYNSG